MRSIDILTVTPEGSIRPRTEFIITTSRNLKVNAVLSRQYYKSIHILKKIENREYIATFPDGSDFTFQHNSLLGTWQTC